MKRTRSLPALATRVADSATPSQLRAAAAPSSAGFWFLLALSALGFAPCVLFPAWMDYERVELARMADLRLTEQMRADVRQLGRTLARIETDPLVTARLSRRELAYHAAGDLEVLVPVVVDATNRVSADALAPMDSPDRVAPPDWLGPLVQHLPRLDYEAVFDDEPTRRLLTCLSAGPLFAALLLFGPARRRYESRP